MFSQQVGLEMNEQELQNGKTQVHAATELPQREAQKNQMRPKTYN